MLKPSIRSDSPNLPQGQLRADVAEQVERRLLEQVVARQLAAFEKLYAGYHPRLTRFLDRLTRRPSLVEEVLNDTMFVVWTRPQGYNGQCKVSTWIFAIAYRKAMKALQQIDEPVDDVDRDLRPSDLPGPEEQLDQHQASDLLRRAIHALSPEHRAVVELTYFHGADYREIALIVDCPVATVKTRMFHARRRLKALLPPDLDSQP